MIAPEKCSALAQPLGRLHYPGMYVTQRDLPMGDGGTITTVQKMVALVNGSIAKPVVRGQAVNIVKTAPPRASADQISLIRNWLEDHVNFLADPTGVELLHDPELLVRSIQQNAVIHVDCDDVAMLGAALGKAVGLKARFQVVGFLDSRAPFSHVYTELSGPYTPLWADLDTTRDAQGISPRMVTRRLVVEV